MTTDLRNPPPLPDVHERQRRWAVELLDLPDATPAAAARAIELADFGLYGNETLAVRIVSAGENGSFSRHEQARLRAQDEQSLRAEMDKFTERFFAMDTAERRQAHAGLLERTHGYPALQAHLKRLAAGLSLTTASFPTADEDERQLVKFAMRSFVCWPAEAARSRQAFSRSLNEDRHWNEVARRSVKRFPQLRALVPEFLRVEEREFQTARKRSNANNPQFRRKISTADLPWWIVVPAILVSALGVSIWLSYFQKPRFGQSQPSYQANFSTGRSLDEFNREQGEKKLREMLSPENVRKSEALQRLLRLDQDLNPIGDSASSTSDSQAKKPKSNAGRSLPKPNKRLSPATRTDASQ